MKMNRHRHHDNPAAVVRRWVEAFNHADAKALAALYHEDASNHQVVREPVKGRDNIQAMFEAEFAQAQMTCLVVNLFQDQGWAILEWKDPNGLRGSGFFKVKNGLIKKQRGYFDQASMAQLQSTKA
ncbi:MAG: nuclear transport factor 2 family protein [Cellvibrionaceae bacterium]|nr:nuclear transport factor 2 family protein [Cellvibrionaceae bacterium]MCV6627735.1 nuclear transport factor 2 family protein [Cellvibrionaceae bacterium]